MKKDTMLRALAVLAMLAFLILGMWASTPAEPMRGFEAMESRR